jgi:hypothetical protein
MPCQGGSRFQRAASILVSTSPGREEACRAKSRHGTQECALQTWFRMRSRRRSLHFAQPALQKPALPFDC